MRLALFGGSFNPPHIGHLVVAQTCADAAGLDRVVWMPAATPPHKQGDPALAPADARLALVERAIAGNDRFAVSDLELRRAGVSYTVDTLRQLADAHPGDELALIVGGDSLSAFASWRAPREILDLASLLVYARPGSDLGDAPDWVLDRTTVVDGLPLDLSSTAVRARVRAGQSVRYLVPDAVRQHVAELGLYHEG